MYSDRADEWGCKPKEDGYKPSVLSELLDGRCFSNRYHPTKPQCQNLAKWKGKGTGNHTDEWQWCDEHAPDEPFREAI